MLTGPELGDAIRAAVKKKQALGFTQRAIAAHFSITPPSLQDWMARGTVRKDRLDAMFEFFADVVGPEHWGMASFPQRKVSLYSHPTLKAEDPAPPAYGDPQIAEIVSLLGSMSDAGREAALASIRGLAAAMPKTNKQTA